MLFDLLLASITVLSCFFFVFLVVFNSFFTIENARIKLALIIPTDAPMIVANDVIKMLPIVTDKTINDLNSQKKQNNYKWFAH